MRKALLQLIAATALLVTTAAAADAMLDDAITAFENGDFDTARQVFEAHPDHPTALMYLSQMVRREDLDESEELIDQAVELAPDYAEAQFQRGITMGAQANASIFSALGYAKKALHSFQRAVELEPETVLYRQGLMGFYLAAPGIAGGDMELAWQQVQEIAKLDARSGMIAELDYLRADDQQETFQRRLKEAVETHSEIPDFYFLAGLNAQAEAEYQRAHELFVAGSQQKAPDERSEKARLSALYQVARTAVFSGNHVAEGTAAIESYLDENPGKPDLPSRDWAEFRLAQLYQLQGDSEQAAAITNRLEKSQDESLTNAIKEHSRAMSGK